MILYLFSLAMLIRQSLPQCLLRFTISSTDHSMQADGYYFNYDKDVIHLILGRQDWSGEIFNVRVVNTGDTRSVKMWDYTDVGSSTGTGHGRREPKSGASTSDWNVDDVVEFVDITCAPTAVPSANPTRSPPQCSFTVLSTDHSMEADGFYFNYDKDAIDRILGRQDWNTEVFDVYVVNSGDTRSVVLWDYTNAGGSIGSGHGRIEPKSGASTSDWNVDDVVAFVDGTCAPTAMPSANPTKSPTEMPSATPSKSPTEMPSESPSKSPTEMPSATPSKSPTEMPTMPGATRSPSEMPSENPSKSPIVTDAPSENPSKSPTEMPSESPSKSPIITDAPSESPSEVPSESPSEMPSEMPSESPSEMPSANPSKSPTEVPSNGPSKAPTNAPTTVLATDASKSSRDSREPGSAAHIGLILNGVIAVVMLLHN